MKLDFVRFSIVIPCYNLSAWIHNCLDSVHSQTFYDWEAIVVDDESTDGSAEVLDEYTRKDSRFKVIHQKNAGEGGARNTGLAHSRGEWIFFLDGDDVMAPDALSKLEKLILKYPNEKLFRFGYSNFEDGKPYPIVFSSVHEDRLVDISKKVNYDDYYVYVWQFIYHKSLLEGMQFDRYKRGADRTFIVPILCNRASAFVATDEVFYFYRQRKGSAMSSRPSTQVLKDELTHRLDMVDLFDSCDKEIAYGRQWWFERYCVFDYLLLAEFSGEYSACQQDELVQWFYHELPRLKRAKQQGKKTKIISNCLFCFHSKFCHRIILLILPKVLDLLTIIMSISSTKKS